MRAARAGGVVGPVGFVAAWVGGGLATDGYSPVRDAISVLAQLGAPTRPWMTAGLVAFGVGVPAFAAVARDLPGSARVALAVAGLGALGVAALPLDPGRDVPAHAVAAGVSYAGFALAPMLAGRHRWVGVVAGACLAASAAGPATGLFQRAGLTLLDAWLVAVALRGGREEIRRTRE